MTDPPSQENRRPQRGKVPPLETFLGKRDRFFVGVFSFLVVGPALIGLAALLFGVTTQATYSGAASFWVAFLGVVPAAIVVVYLLRRWGGSDVVRGCFIASAIAFGVALVVGGGVCLAVLRSLSESI